MLEHARVDAQTTLNYCSPLNSYKHTSTCVAVSSTIYYCHAVYSKVKIGFGFLTDYKGTDSEFRLGVQFFELFFDIILRQKWQKTEGF